MITPNATTTAAPGIHQRRPKRRMPTISSAPPPAAKSAPIACDLATSPAHPHQPWVDQADVPAPAPARPRCTGSGASPTATDSAAAAAAPASTGWRRPARRRRCGRPPDEQDQHAALDQQRRAVQPQLAAPERLGLFKLVLTEIGSRLHRKRSGPEIAGSQERARPPRPPPPRRPERSAGQPSSSPKRLYACASPSPRTSTATSTRSRRSSRPPRPRRTSCGASATSSATAATPTPRSRSRWSTARSAWPATTTSRSSTCSRSRTSRAAPRSPPSGRRRRSSPRRASSCSRSRPEGGAEGVGLYHASPRDPIWEYVLSGLTAELCLDATDYRVSFIGHSHVALSFHRNEGESATGSTRREGDELDISAGGLADQPGQHRPAARRRPAGGLAAARHGGLDRALAARGVRHRGRAGGDPGGQPSRLARRAPSVRSIARCLDCSPSGWRSPPPCS